MTVNYQSPDSDREQPASPLADIDQLFDDLTALAELATDRESFYDSLLSRTAKFSNSTCAVLWINGPGNELVAWKKLEKMPGVFVEARDRPRVHLECDDCTNSCTIRAERSKQSTFIATPISVLDQRIGILAFYRAAVESDEITQAYLPLLDAVGEVAGEFEKNQKLLQREQDGKRFQSISRLSLNAHYSLSSKHAAFNLVNDGREYIGCDRVGLFVGSFGRAKLLACSGVATTNSRSSYARTLGPVIKRVLRTGQPIVVQQDSDSLKRDVRRYLDTFPADQQPQQIAIVPLFPPQLATKRAKSKPVGAMVFESFDCQDTANFFQSINEVTEHSCSAITNALRYERIPLLWFWNLLFAMTNQLRLQNLFRTFFWSALLAAAVYFLVVSKAEFKVEALGELRPVQERNVFAPADGIVNEILVQHGDSVQAQQTILTLRSPELELELKQIEGDIETAQQKRDGLLTIMKTADASDPDNNMVQSRLAADVIETESVISGLSTRREFVKQRISEMVVLSPISGDVVTWQVAQLLAGRPVRRGESLLKIADVSGQWQVVLDVPDKKYGYITSAQQSERRIDLAVSLALASRPAKKFETRLSSVSLASLPRENQESSVRVTAPMNAADVQSFKPGESVVGRVHCGQHNIVYVWTVELVDALKRKFFW